MRCSPLVVLLLAASSCSGSSAGSPSSGTPVGGEATDPGDAGQTEEQTFADGMMAVCQCPIEVEERRKPDWAEGEMTVALAACMRRNAINDEVRIVLGQLATSPKEQRGRILEAATERAGLSSCALATAWDKSTTAADAGPVPTDGGA